MPDLVLPILLLVVGGLSLVLLWRSGAFTPAAASAWARIGRHHHLTDDRPLDERLADRVPSLARFFRETSVPRLLRIANRREGLNAWLLRVAIYVLLVTIAMLSVDLMVSVATGALPVPPVLCLLVGGVFVPLSYLTLQSEAHRRQDALNRAIAQSLTEMAILTYAGQYTVASALDFVARCHRQRVLLDLLSGTDRQRPTGIEALGLNLGLRPNQLLSTVTIYERIGTDYDVEMFNELAVNMRRIAEKGLVPSDVLTSLSVATGKRQLGELTVKTEQARPRMALAIGLMVLPLLSLILFPAAMSIGSAFN
jgi:hypothetical protein